MLLVFGCTSLIPLLHGDQRLTARARSLHACASRRPDVESLRVLYASRRFEAETLKATLLIEDMMQRQQTKGECTRCWLPLDLCLCGADGRIQAGLTNRVDVVVAMHYKEFGKKKNTARLLPLALPSHAQMVTHPMDTPALLDRMQATPSLLLWPGTGSLPASSYRDWVADVTAGEEEERVLLIVLDGTWGQVKNMAREFMRAGVRLVHVSDVASVSIMDDRRQIATSRVTTAEAVALALGELGEPAAAAALTDALHVSANAYRQHLERNSNAEFMEAKRAGVLERRAVLPGRNIQK